MDKLVKDFLNNNSVLKAAMDSGKDPYSTLASKMFRVPYEECTEYKDGVPNIDGKKRRSAAKLAVLFFVCDGKVDVDD